MLSPHIKLFQKIKRGLELVSLPHFLHNFWRKIFLLLYSINWPNFIVWLPLLCEILGNMCIAIVCKPGCDVMNFEVNLIFLINLFFLNDQRVMTKTWISWERKELLRWNRKHFSSFFHHFSRAFNQANNTNFFAGWESDFNMQWKQVVCSLVSIYSYSPQLAIK